MNTIDFNEKLLLKQIKEVEEYLNVDKMTLNECFHEYYRSMMKSRYLGGKLVEEAFDKIKPIQVLQMTLLISCINSIYDSGEDIENILKQLSNSVRSNKRAINNVKTK